MAGNRFELRLSIAARIEQPRIDGIPTADAEKNDRSCAYREPRLRRVYQKRETRQANCSQAIWFDPLPYDTRKHLMACM